jgi:ATP-dependent RNA helicase DDX5/DBP2
MLSVNRKLLTKTTVSFCRGYHPNSPLLNRYGDFNSNIQTRRFEDNNNGGRFGQQSGIGSRFGGEEKTNKKVEDVEVKRLSFVAEDADAQATKQWRTANDISVVGMGVTCPPPILSFEQAPFLATAKDCLTKMFSVPTPIQSQGWAIAMAGHNMVGVAKTGSGKTMAFILPALEHIHMQEKKKNSGPRALILAPTRELAQQIESEINQIVGKYRVKALCLFGGQGNRSFQIRQLHYVMPEIVVATPGRLVDLNDAGYCDLSNVTCLVLDEADRMLDMGFGAQLRDILERIPREEQRQTLMWTATWSKEVESIARDSFHSYVRLNVGNEKLAANENIKQEVMVLQEDERYDALKNILEKNPDKKILIFVSRKIDCEYIGSMLYNKLGIKQLASIHGDKSQDQRNNILEDFKKSILRIVVATDVAARGLDVKDIDIVINYDFPQDIETYVHRIGRTARAGKTGLSISFMTPSSYGLVNPLVDQMKLSKQVIDPSLLTLQQRVQQLGGRGSGGGNRNRGRGGGGGGSPYGDKFAQPQHNDRGGGGGGRNDSFSSRSPFQAKERSFDTDDWIMKKNNQQQSSQHNRGGQRKPAGSTYQDDDEDDLDFLLTPKSSSSSYGGSSQNNSRDNSAENKPKFATFEELMQKLKNTQETRK